VDDDGKRKDDDEREKDDVKVEREASELLSNP